MKKFILLLLFLAVSLFAKIDINSASEKELMTLKNVGPKKAQSIIEYREKNGKFKTIEELEKVKGFSKTILKSLENEIEAK